jgi:hypothetical protein
MNAYLSEFLKSGLNFLCALYMTCASRQPSALSPSSVAVGYNRYGIKAIIRHKYFFGLFFLKKHWNPS